MAIRFETDGPVAVVTIDRPEVANAIDGPTARELADAFRRFDGDEALSVAVLTGADGKFCAGAGALLNEHHHGMASLATGEIVAGVARYARGEWDPDDFPLTGHRAARHQAPRRRGRYFHSMRSPIWSPIWLR
jgi:enoyl-CoA hydratase/carnithine racemase